MQSERPLTGEVRGRSSVLRQMLEGCYALCVVVFIFA